MNLDLHKLHVLGWDAFSCSDALFGPWLLVVTAWGDWKCKTLIGPACCPEAWHKDNLQKPLFWHIPTLTNSSREEKEPKCGGALLWSGMVRSWSGSCTNVQLDVTARFACLGRVFVLLIKIGRWGNVQVVGGIPPTGKPEWKCTGCTSWHGGERRQRLAAGSAPIQCTCKVYRVCTELNGSDKQIYLPSSHHPTIPHPYIHHPHSPWPTS